MWEIVTVKNTNIIVRKGREIAMRPSHDKIANFVIDYWRQSTATEKILFSNYKKKDKFVVLNF